MEQSKMDRMEHEEFKGGDESIEDWLDRLEAKMEAAELRADNRKIKWCKAKIGNAGLQVLKGVEPIHDWEQAKAELIRYFGDEDVVGTAWRNLEFYHAGNKPMGEIAAEIINFARKASSEEHTRQRLAVRAFVNAIPKKIGDRIKEKRITTLKKALEEAKYLQTIQEERRTDRQIQQFGCEEEETTPLEIQSQTIQRNGSNGNYQERQSYQDQNRGFEPRRTTGFYQGNQDFRRQDQMYQPRRASGRRGWDQGQSGYRYRDPREVECWACRQRGHFARECSLWREFIKDRRNSQTKEQGGVRQDFEKTPTFHLNY